MDIFKKAKKFLEELFYNIEIKKDIEKTKGLDKKIEDVNILLEKLTNYNKHKNDLENELQEAKEKSKKYEKFDELQNTKVHKINRLLKQRERINNQKIRLKDKIYEYNKGLDYLYNHEDKMEVEIKKLEALSNEQKDLKRKIDEGKIQKEEFANQNKINIKVFDILNKISIGTIGFFIIGLFLMNTILTTYEKEAFWPTFVLVVVSILWATWLYIFRRNLRVKINNNKFKHLNIVKKLNKDKLRYIETTRYLNNKFDKFNVTNMVTLKAYWEEYKDNKQLTNKFKQLMVEMMEIEEKIDKELDPMKVGDMESLKSYAEEIVGNSFTKSELKNHIKRSISTLNSKIDKLILEQKDIIKELDKIKENDITEENILTILIDTYISDMQEVLREHEEIDEVDVDKEEK